MNAQLSSKGLLQPDPRSQYINEAVVAILNAHSLGKVEDEHFVNVVMTAVELHACASKLIMMEQLAHAVTAGLMGNDEKGHANIAETIDTMMTVARNKRHRLVELNSLVVEALTAPRRN